MATSRPCSPGWPEGIYGWVGDIKQALWAPGRPKGAGFRTSPLATQGNCFYSLYLVGLNIINICVSNFLFLVEFFAHFPLFSDCPAQPQRLEHDTEPGESGGNRAKKRTKAWEAGGLLKRSYGRRGTRMKLGMLGPLLSAPEAPGTEVSDIELT